MVWVKFLIGAVAIILAGARLSRYGDEIARRTGLGGALIGIILLSTVTSLPELAVATASVALVGSPDLALGGLLGSNTFNLLIIALLDLMYTSGPLLAWVYPSHILSASLGVSFVGIVIGLILYYQQGGLVQIGDFGLGSAIFVTMYFVSVRLIYRFEGRRRERDLEARTGPGVSRAGLGILFLKTAAVAMVIVSAGVWLSITGDEIAATMGWGESFVGGLFLAVATSLPEMVVSIGALRIGAVDMAISNVLGSNLFNMVIIVVCDFLYWQGPFLAAVSPATVMAGLTSIVMTGIVITGLIYRTVGKSSGRAGWESAALGITYLSGSYFLFTLSKP